MGSVPATKIFLDSCLKRQGEIELRVFSLRATAARKRVIFLSLLPRDELDEDRTVDKPYITKTEHHNVVRSIVAKQTCARLWKPTMRSCSSVAIALLLAAESAAAAAASPELVAAVVRKYVSSIEHDSVV